MTLTEKGFPWFTVFPAATHSILHSGGEGVPTWNNLNTVVHLGIQDKANSSLFSFSFLIHMLAHITKLAAHKHYLQRASEKYTVQALKTDHSVAHYVSL